MLLYKALKNTMKKSDFLRKLRTEGRLIKQEPSRELSEAYLSKAENCLRSAQILFLEKLYENTVAEAYYATYNAALALLFLCGIKSENHNATIVLLGMLGLPALEEQLAYAKKERIDKQYYLTDQDNEPLTMTSTKEMITYAEEFLLAIQDRVGRLQEEDILQARATFDELSLDS